MIKLINIFLLLYFFSNKIHIAQNATTLCSMASPILLLYQSLSDNSDGRLHCVRRHPNEG